MNQDQQNLNLLAIFHYVLGALTIVGSSFFLFHVAIGIAIVSGTLDGKNAKPDAFGWIFVAMGSIVVLSGWTIGILMIIAGGKLSRHVSRTFCLVVAGIECIITPLGTVLGVFTIVVLMKESVTKLFAGPDIVNSGLESPPNPV